MAALFGSESFPISRPFVSITGTDATDAAAKARADSFAAPKQVLFKDRLAEALAKNAISFP